LNSTKIQNTALQGELHWKNGRRQGKSGITQEWMCQLRCHRALMRRRFLTYDGRRVLPRGLCSGVLRSIDRCCKTQVVLKDKKFWMTGRFWGTSGEVTRVERQENCAWTASQQTSRLLNYHGSKSPSLSLVLQRLVVDDQPRLEAYTTTTITTINGNDNKNGVAHFGLL
jgi:hypothetical protein